jgi:pimeloyl-ACP methyl ester carboxylesterase
LRDGWIDVATQEDYSSEVAKVDVPVAVIAGDADKVAPLDVVKAHILPAFRNPETHFLKNKGHLLPIEARRELVEILGKFAARAFA